MGRDPRGLKGAPTEVAAVRAPPELQPSQLLAPGASGAWKEQPVWRFGSPLPASFRDLPGLPALLAPCSLLPSHIAPSICSIWLPTALSSLPCTSLSHPVLQSVLISTVLHPRECTYCWTRSKEACAEI